jgi:hypothetical protein
MFQTILQALVPVVFVAVGSLAGSECSTLSAYVP